MKPEIETEAGISLEDMFESILSRKWLVLAVWALVSGAAVLHA